MGNKTGVRGHHPEANALEQSTQSRKSFHKKASRCMHQALWGLRGFLLCSLGVAGDRWRETGPFTSLRPRVSQELGSSRVLTGRCRRRFEELSPVHL